VLSAALSYSRAAVVGLALAACTGVHAQPAVRVDPLHQPLDELLDLYVRDGFVYYNALRSDRTRLDRYVAALNGDVAERHASGTTDERRALWINAYNALVLRTVVDRFPIRGGSPAYPANSIRQIPGAFDRATHRVAGRVLTLDAIEKEMLTPLGDARVFLALGRGAIGGGRLRSEAYDAARLGAQLDAVAAETMTRKEMVTIDVAANTVTVSPIFSWREQSFVSDLAAKAAPTFAQRSPLERAVLALIGPHVVGSEADFLATNQFRLTFSPFDWRLNDLGSRP
jgi:hypothetical protein